MVLQKILRASILYLLKRFSVLVFSLLFAGIANSQTITKEFKKNSSVLFFPKSKILKNKTIPLQYDTITRIALMYYPELENTKIKIRIKMQASPLTARPSLFAIFSRASKRNYIITISNKVDSKFSTILLSNLSFNSQIGVIGHELGHIADYNSRYGIYFIKLLFMHLNKRKMDRFEYNTDMRCIEHGLGYQLLSWSKEVRLKLNLIQWKGIKHLNKQGRERYMNPESITKTISQSVIYN